MLVINLAARCCIWQVPDPLAKERSDPYIPDRSVIEEMRRQRLPSWSVSRWYNPFALDDSVAGGTSRLSYGATVPVLPSRALPGRDQSS